MKRVKKALASLLAASICLSVAVCPAAAADGAESQSVGAASSTVDTSTVWQYLDNNTDPGTQEDPTSWTQQVDPTAEGWKTDAGSFGAKRGQKVALSGGLVPDVLLEGCDGQNDYTTYFFRTTFQVDNAAEATQLLGQITYDDAVIVYVNGVKVAGLNEPEGGYASNMAYGCKSTVDAPLTENIAEDDTSMLVDGTNTLAVELHQDRQTSSDVYLAVNNFSVSTEQPSNELEVDSLTVNIGKTEDCLGITWYDTSSEADVLHFGGKDYTAEVKQASKTGYYVNHVDLSGLTASTDYTYTISSGEKTTKEYRYTTPAFGSDSFSFAAVGDPQLYYSSLQANVDGWTKTVSEITSDGTDYSFLFSLGDQINEYYAANGSNLNVVETEYSGFFQNENLHSIALATLVGNHDNGDNSTLYTEHFQMPGVTSYGQNREGDGDYAFTYGGVQFMVLNTSNLSIAEHKEFMEKTLAENPDANWNVVCFHKSMYSVASHVTEPDIVTLRTGLSPIFKQLGIDVVLQGHDHVYARSYIMGGEDGMTADEKRTEDGEALKDIYAPDGVQYVTLNSGSGSKFYKITNEAFTYTAVQNQEKVPNYSSISVTPDTFTVTTYRTSDQSVVDTFTLHKGKAPNKPGETPTPPSETPVKPSETPAKPSETPVKPSETPATPSETPATPSETPAKPSETPAKPSETPVKPSETPAKPSETPAKPSETPATPSETPAKPSETPATPSETPVKPSETPTPADKPCDGGDNCPSNGFKDVDTTKYYHDAVDKVYSEGTMIGIGEQEFGVGHPMTRGMVVTVLYRMAGSPAVQGGSIFTDVKAGTYYENAAIWAQQNGITEGVGEDRFAPAATVTREQMVTFLYRYAKKYGADVTSGDKWESFTDHAQVSSYAREAMGWAVKTGLVEGTGNQQLSPRYPLLREQCAQLLVRFEEILH